MHRSGGFPTRVGWSVLVVALAVPAFATAAQDKKEEKENAKDEALLSRFSSNEQVSIRNACGEAALVAPATLHACIRTKAAELKQSPGPPDLSTLSSSLQDSIRNACARANLAGPASYYDCLGRKVGELRRSPGRPDLSAFSPADQDAMRTACAEANQSGPASFYECLRLQAADLRRRSSATPRADAVARTGEVARPADTGRVRTRSGSRDASKPTAHTTASPEPGPSTLSNDAVPDPLAVSGRWLGWILVLVGLAGWPVVLHFYKARTKPCSVCETPTSNAGTVCDACLRDADDDRRRREQEAEAARSREQAEARRRPTRGASDFDPHAVLGVPPGATLDQIKTAYRALIVQYHPDKVAQLGSELRQLAAQKSQQINDAYQLLEREAR